MARLRPETYDAKKMTSKPPFRLLLAHFDDDGMKAGFEKWLPKEVLSEDVELVIHATYKMNELLEFAAWCAPDVFICLLNNLFCDSKEGLPSIIEYTENEDEECVYQQKRFKTALRFLSHLKNTYSFPVIVMLPKSFWSDALLMRSIKEVCDVITPYPFELEVFGEQMKEAVSNSA